MKKLPLAIAISAALLSSSVIADELQPLQFYGYMQAGIGIGSNSGENPSVSKYGDDNDGVHKEGIGRLGNENDIYGEIGLKKELYNQDGVSFLVDTMIASAQRNDHNWESHDFVWSQLNVQAKGLFAFDKEAVLWAGNRYYKQHNINMTDFYYWDTSGVGGGIENVTVGPGKLSVAVLQDDGDQGNWNTGSLVADPVKAFNLDVRYSGIGLWSTANLELGVNYNYANEKADQKVVADDGVMLTSILTQWWDSGFNETVIQYGTSSYGSIMVNYKSAGGNWFDRSGDQNDATGARIINNGTASFGENFEFGHQILLGYANDVEVYDAHFNPQGKGNGVTTSIVVRPMYKWDERMKTILELGYTSTVFDMDNSSDDIKEGNTKVTLAQAWSAGSSFWARPEIRIYTSYITDTEDENAFGKDEDSEFSVGIHTEAWW